MQIALGNDIYLVDCHILENRISEDDWKKFFNVLFFNDEIKKIGYLMAIT